MSLNLNTLFSFHPTIRFLRNQRALVTAQLIAAIASRNAAEIIRCKIELKKIETSLKKIGLNQLAIIRSSEIELLRQVQITRLALQQAINNSSVHYHKSIQSEGFVKLINNPQKLFIRPDSKTESAPIYEPEEGFIAKQSQQIFWRKKNYLSNKNWLSNFIKNSNEEEDSCSVEINYTANRFSAKIKWDKFF